MSRYNTAQAFILVVAFISYIIAQGIGATDSNTSTTMLFIFIVATLQSIASWHFNQQYKNAQELATCLKNAREAEIKKLEQCVGGILLASVCILLFILESIFITNIFYN